jgi:hypothetical protein
MYTKHRQWKPLPVIHTIDFTIHNGSVVGIVTLILTFGIVRKSPEEGHWMSRNMSRL